MAKKNFSAGLDSLFGDSPATEVSDTPLKEEAPKPKAGVSSSNKEIHIDPSHLKKIEVLAFWEKTNINTIVNRAVDFYLDFQMDLKPIPKKTTNTELK